MISELENKTFLTNSDAHSLPKIAREYNKMLVKDISFKEVVKALKGEDGRKAIALATDSDEGARTTSRIIDTMGFDPVFIGGLENGRKLEPGAAAFGASVSAAQLRSLVGVY